LVKWEGPSYKLFWEIQNCFAKFTRIIRVHALFMKKIIIILSGISLLGFSSCTRTFNCTCYQNLNPSDVFTVHIKAKSIVDATSQCPKQTDGGTATCAY
jgi:hypothetical protein